MAEGPEYELVEPLLKLVRALLAEHAKLGALPERYLSTENNVAFLLARTRKAGPLERAAEVAKLEEQVAQLTSAAAVLEQSPQLANEAATTKTKLESAQAELTRRKRDRPTSASEHCLPCPLM